MGLEAPRKLCVGFLGATQYIPTNYQGKLSVSFLGGFMYYSHQRLTFLQLLSLLINKPKVVPSPCKDGLWSVRKLGIRGWKYLDLWNFKNWRYQPHQELGSGFWTRCCASESRAEMAKLFNSEPPVF